MSSRERILKTLNHEEPDRIPLDLGGTESSGMTAYSLFDLYNHLDIHADLRIFEPYQYVAYIGEELTTRFRIDTANLTPEPKSWVKQFNQLGLEVRLPEKWCEKISENGSTIVRRADGTVAACRPKDGYYFDPINPPLGNITKPTEVDRNKDIISSFDWPSFVDESDEDLQRRAQEMHNSGKCVVFNLCCHILAAGQLLRGYENFMIDLLTNEAMVRKLLDCLIEGYLNRVDWLAPLLKDKVDVILLNDDLGTQNAPMLSPSTYRKIIKPYQQELFGHVKKAFGKPILFHSCGAVREFIPDLIEMGVDALNPVQISAEGMDPKELKKDFGKDITFWGGGIDTQTILNKGTPGEIENAVKRSVDILAPGGGFVFTQVHNIQPDVAPENVVAMNCAFNRYADY
jgi:uroporphyrinogen decarboxylase